MKWIKELFFKHHALLFMTDNYDHKTGDGDNSAKMCIGVDTK